MDYFQALPAGKQDRIVMMVLGARVAKQAAAAANKAVYIAEIEAKIAANEAELVARQEECLCNECGGYTCGGLAAYEQECCCDTDEEDEDDE